MPPTVNAAALGSATAFFVHLLAQVVAGAFHFLTSALHLALHFVAGTPHLLTGSLHFRMHLIARALHFFSGPLHLTMHLVAGTFDFIPYPVPLGLYLVTRAVDARFELLTRPFEGAADLLKWVSVHDSPLYCIVCITQHARN